MARFSDDVEVGTIQVPDRPPLPDMDLPETDFDLGKGDGDYLDELTRLSRQIAVDEGELDSPFDVIAEPTDFLTPFDRKLRDAREAIGREEWEAALEPLGEALTERSDSTEARYLAAYCLFQLERLEEALGHLKGLGDDRAGEIAAFDSSADVATGLAAGTGQPEAVLDPVLSGKVTELRGRIRSAMVSRVMYENLQLVQAGRLDEAIGRLERCVQLDPAVGLYHFMLAGDLMMAERFDDALVAAETGLAHAHGDDRHRLEQLREGIERAALSARLAPAREHFRNRNYPRARAALKKLEPRYRDTRLCRTFEAYLEKLGGGLMGLRAGRPLVEVPPPGRFLDVDALHFFLVEPEIQGAKLLMALGQLELASQVAQHALEHAPHFPYAHFLRGVCLYQGLGKAMSEGRTPGLEEATAILEAAHAHAEFALRDDEIEGAAELSKGVESGLEGLREVRRELEARAEEVRRFNLLAETFQGMLEEAREGIRGAAHFHDIRGRMAQLQEDVTSFAREVEIEEVEEVVENLTEAVDSSLEQLDSMEEEVSRAEELDSLSNEFQAIMKRAGDGISSTQHVELLQAMLDLRERVRALRDEGGSEAFEKAVAPLADAVETNCDQLLEIGKTILEGKKLEPLMEEFGSIMQSAGSGVTSRDDAERLADRLQTLRRSAADLEDELETEEARKNLAELRQAIDRNLGQLREIQASMDETQLVNPLVERFNALMEGAQGGISSYAALEAFRSSMEKLFRDVGELSGRMQSEQGKKALMDLATAIAKVMSQLQDQ